MQRVIPKLLTWYSENYRQLPWRETQNPYHIWVSEIILQQTRVDQGLSYYYRFLDKFPEIHDLAHASEAEILKVWQGLGYYARARNMQKAAKMILSTFNGVFPSNYTEILQLPGVGNYTAAAIASFAFKLPVAAIDGNVKRVISRFIGIDTPIDKMAFLKSTQQYLNEQIPRTNPDIFNQAMIELGAMVCTPTQPKCLSCALLDECYAAREAKQNLYPVVAKKQKATNWSINYALVENAGEILLSKRESKGIWGGLHEFPQLSEKYPLEKEKKIAEFEHKLSHKNITAHLFKVDSDSHLSLENKDLVWVKLENINFFPMHKLMLKFVEYLGWK
jgi:A/G-specific adenine glycosylase